MQREAAGIPIRPTRNHKFGNELRYTRIERTREETMAQIYRTTSTTEILHSDNERPYCFWGSEKPMLFKLQASSLACEWSHSMFNNNVIDPISRRIPPVVVPLLWESETHCHPRWIYGQSHFVLWCVVNFSNGRRTFWTRYLSFSQRTTRRQLRGLELKPSEKPRKLDPNRTNRIDLPNTS